MDALLLEIRRTMEVRELLSLLANDSLAGTLQEDYQIVVVDQEGRVHKVDRFWTSIDPDKGQLMLFATPELEELRSEMEDPPARLMNVA
jgi:hypothetical protein